MSQWPKKSILLSIFQLFNIFKCFGKMRKKILTAILIIIFRLTIYLKKTGEQLLLYNYYYQ